MALLFGSASVALAEESGGFVGIGIGGGGTELSMTGYDDTNNFDDTLKDSGIDYGFVVGYKQFFNEYLGLRYYANLDIHHNLGKEYGFNVDEFGNDILERSDITLINYGVNVDFLGNFVVTDIADFGGFIGFGIGGNTIKGKYFKDMEAGFVGSKFKYTGFDAWLNLGLRTNIAKYHGVELVARVPFLPMKLVDYTYETGSAKYTFGQKYNILARYTFSF